MHVLLHQTEVVTVLHQDLGFEQRRAGSSRNTFGWSQFEAHQFFNGGSFCKVLTSDPQTRLCALELRQFQQFVVFVDDFVNFVLILDCLHQILSRVHFT